MTEYAQLIFIDLFLALKVSQNAPGCGCRLRIRIREVLINWSQWSRSMTWRERSSLNNEGLLVNSIIL